MTTVDAGPTSPGVDTTARASDPLVEAPSFTYDVAIVGLGYVGLPTALAYFAAGARVLALDVSAARLAQIREQRADLLPSDRERLAIALEDERFAITDAPADIADAAAVIVCVPTPVDEYLSPDLVPLRSASAMVVSLARPGQLLMLTSTTYVGCTTDFLVTPLAERGMVAGEDVFVAFSPERIDPGNDSFAQEVVPRVVGGATEECRERAVEVLGRYAARVHPVSSLEAAEMTKLLENTFRAVNIALANEFADISTELGVDVAEVIDAAATKPYGFMKFTPGPGVGGHCIPCDPHYLLWQLRRSRAEAPMIAEAMNQIAARPRRIVDRVRDVLDIEQRSLRGARVAVVGVTYKPDVDDVRESPAIEIIEGLLEQGADVAYVDPHATSLRLRSGHTLESLTDPGAFGADVVLIHTRHRDADLGWIDGSVPVLDATYRAVELPRRTAP